MPTINSEGWKFSAVPEAKFLHCGDVKLPMFCRSFAPPNDSYAIIYPASHLGGRFWGLYLAACRKYAAYDPKGKIWVWSKLSMEKVTSVDSIQNLNTPAALTKAEREAVRAERKRAEANFDARLAELSKAENVPEDQWASYHYPAHFKPGEPFPTALQRIAVSRYWNKPGCLLGASVGAGKSRMVIDCLTARALHPPLADSARIILVIAPLSLATNWQREFQKWSIPGIHWLIHKFEPTVRFWRSLEDSANFLFETGTMKPGGLVIICTQQALSRDTMLRQFTVKGLHPTAIIVDEIQRSFRKPDNRAFKNIRGIRKNAHCFIGLSGTPTSKMEDWHSVEALVAGDVPDAHWRNASYTDYQKLGDKELMTTSGLWQRGWTFERAIKEFHADRIAKGRIFIADKAFYMRDALPGLDQEELGQYADMRLSFHDLFMDEALVKRAYTLQVKQNPTTTKMDQRTLATTLLLRMQQLAALGNDDLLLDFVRDFLDPGEPCVFWTLFRNEPCEELPRIVAILSKIAPTAFIQGGMDEKTRWEAIDGFSNGKYTYLVSQTEAGGVGLNLVRACKHLFLSIPLGYQSVCQCIGRLHRIGQDRDVTSYFAMTSPVAAFARHIYDRRVELNEEIPQQISGVLSKIVVDSKQGSP